MPTHLRVLARPPTPLPPIPLLPWTRLHCPLGRKQRRNCTRGLGWDVLSQLLRLLLSRINLSALRDSPAAHLLVLTSWGPRTSLLVSDARRSVVSAFLWVLASAGRPSRHTKQACLGLLQRSTIHHDSFLTSYIPLFTTKATNCLELNSTLELVGMDSSVLALVQLPALPFISFPFLLLPYLLLPGECFLVCALMQLPSGSHHHLPVMGLSNGLG